MKSLFSAMSSEYPFFLPKSDDDAVNKLLMWVKLLRPYDNNDRQIALEKCLVLHKKSGGPSVGDFLELLNSRPDRRELPTLPAPEVDPEFARKMFDEAKAILRRA